MKSAAVLAAALGSIALLATQLPRRALAIPALLAVYAIVAFAVFRPRKEPS